MSLALADSCRNIALTAVAASLLLPVAFMASCMVAPTSRTPWMPLAPALAADEKTSGNWAAMAFNSKAPFLP